LYTSETCPYAHPPAHCPLDAESLVTVCVDYVKGKCARETCKYFHPPAHLVAQLKAVKAQSAAAAHVFSAAAAAAAAANVMPFSPSTFQYLQPVSFNNNATLLTAYASQGSNETIIASSSSSASSPLVCIEQSICFLFQMKISIDENSFRFVSSFLRLQQQFMMTMEEIIQMDIFQRIKLIQVHYKRFIQPI